MEILTIKDKNYNVTSMKDIFEILNSNGMNEVSRYIKRYLDWLSNQLYDMNEDLLEVARYEESYNISDVCRTESKFLKEIFTVRKPLYETRSKTATFAAGAVFSTEVI